ncbi:11599_t:CDS:2 [Funneliformis geosporum]|uniref:11599_t:CDS:1 n=1 Tax=Funneliformis geosporum TaxID=1117311 RepID=A0A9W4SX57_9GLOM|nr:11599_t:CDS:2 [Funneliformis geosporum]
MTDQYVQIVFLTDKTKLDEWTQNIKFGLKEILSSRLGNEQRDKALSLVMLLLHHIGAPWLFASTIENLSFNQTSANKVDDFKFAALVVQLACVEIRLLLDDLADQYEKQELQEFQSNKRNEFLLSACYTILEKSIEYLSQIENLLESQFQGSSIELTGLNLDPELLLRLKGTMIETFRFIIEHLMDIKETTSVEKVIKDESILASIRVLSVWLAEESSLEKEISKMMPFLIEICQYSLTCDIEVNLIKIMTPAFLNLTSLDQPRETFLKHGGPQIMIDYLVKFWSNKKDFNGIYDLEINEILGPIQVLLNIVVSDKETFIIGNEDEVWKIIKIGLQISKILEPKLKLYDHNSKREDQIILLENTLLFCLLVISSSKFFEMDAIKNIIDTAKIFYNNQNITLQQNMRKHDVELLLLGKQVLDNILSESDNLM